MREAGTRQQQIRAAGYFILLANMYVELGERELWWLVAENEGSRMQRQASVKERVRSAIWG